MRKVYALSVGIVLLVSLVAVSLGFAVFDTGTPEERANFDTLTAISNVQVVMNIGGGDKRTLFDASSFSGRGAVDGVHLLVSGTTSDDFASRKVATGLEDLDFLERVHSPLFGVEMSGLGGEFYLFVNEDELKEFIVTVHFNPPQGSAPFSVGGGTFNELIDDQFSFSNEYVDIEVLDSSERQLKIEFTPKFFEEVVPKLAARPSSSEEGSETSVIAAGDETLFLSLFGAQNELEQECVVPGGTNQVCEKEFKIAFQSGKLIATQKLPIVADVEEFLDRKPPGRYTFNLEIYEKEGSKKKSTQKLTFFVTKP